MLHVLRCQSWLAQPGEAAANAMSYLRTDDGAATQQVLQQGMRTQGAPQDVQRGRMR